MRSVTTAMTGGRLRPDVLGLEERNVAVVLDDQPMHAARDKASASRMQAS